MPYLLFPFYVLFSADYGGAGTFARLQVTFVFNISVSVTYYNIDG